MIRIIDVTNDPELGVQRVILFDHLCGEINIVTLDACGKPATFVCEYHGTDGIVNLYSCTLHASGYPSQKWRPCDWLQDF
jgi:hypothetical protein